jgi:hypothetical protein
MKPVSLADITFEQGLQLLALRKQGLDSGTICRMSKEAMDNNYPLHAVGMQVVESVKEAEGYVDDFRKSISDVGSSLRDGFDGVKGGVQNWWGKLNKPTQSTLTHGAIGAGLGAASGVGASLMNGGRHYSRNMLMGGLSGGAIGGGIGIARNPKIADSLREKIEAMLQSAETTDSPPPPPTASATKSPAGEVQDQSLGEQLGLTQPESKLTGEELTTEGKRITELPEGLRRDEINRHRATLEQSPNTTANLLHGANIAGTTYLGGKLHDPAGHSIEAMAQTLKAMPTSGSNNGRPAFQPDAVRTHLGGYAPELLENPAALQKMSIPEIEKLLRKNPNLRSSLFGNARSTGRVAVESLMGQPATGAKLVPGATRSGFGWRRPFRGAGLLGLLGLSAYGAAQTEAGRAAGRSAQENAKALLDVLETMAFKDKK